MILLLQFMMAPSVYSSPLSYLHGAGNSQSSLKTTLSVLQVGKLSVPGGLVVIDGNSVEIQAVPEGLFDPRPVLSGVIVNSQSVPAASPQTIKGLAYFFAGAWLNYVSQSPSFELVEKNDGTMLAGQIVGGDEKSISLRQSNGVVSSIEFLQIANIESPRAFSFLIPFSRSNGLVSTMVQGDARSIRFQPNNGRQAVIAARRIAAPLLGDEHGITKGQITSYLMLDLFATIAPIIATPLVLQRANYLSAERLVNKTNAASALSSSGGGP